MKSKGKVRYRRKRRAGFLAAAALTAALICGQAFPAAAGSGEAQEEIRAIIPENITVDQPVALEEIGLPESEYGTLSWADPSYVPSSRVEACAVVLTPAEGVDLSWMSGWSEEEGVWKGTVTVVVSSLESPAGTESEDMGADTETQTEDTENGNSGENPEIPGDSDQNTADGQEETGEGQAQEPGAEDEAVLTPAGEKEEALPSEGETQSQDGEQGEAPAPGEENGEIQTPEEGEDPAPGEEDGEEQKPGEESGETPDPGEENGEDPEKPEGDQPGLPEDGSGDTDEPDNIFDRTEEPEDDRPVTVEDNLTEEEQIRRAAENHTCAGIYVSGIHLPWYVQFRATSGDAYEFTNEKTANIFKSYELELWDLKNDTEYVIPDGEYISVTVPVKEGYEYTVEHILPSGAVETIIPSVEGSTLIFSTHSFSPFGIAGSQPVVGGEVSDKNYPEGTPSPTPTPTKKPSVTVRPTATPAARPTVSGSQGSSGSTVVDKDHSGYDYSNREDGGTGASQTPAPDNSGNGSGSTASSPRAVATGDDTMILPFVLMMVLDLMLIAAAAVLKKRKAR